MKVGFSDIRILRKIALLSFPVLLIGAIYLIEDPFKVLYSYSVYYESGKPSYIPINRDWVSTKMFLLNYPIYKYNSIIFGNSRSIFYEVEDWKKYISSNECFHFDASGESIYGIYKKVLFLNSNEIKIKNAIIVLDYETLNVVTNSGGRIFLKHPAVSKDGYLMFQIESLKAFFSSDFLKGYLLFKLYGVVSGSLDSRPFNYSSVSNEIRFSYYEDMIHRNMTSYYYPRKEMFKRKDTVQQYFPEVIKKQQKEMLEFIGNKLRNDGAVYKIIISPLYDQVGLNHMDLMALHSIFGKSNVFDFSGKNNITSDMHNYYDGSHYRPHVARLIMEKVYF